MKKVTGFFTDRHFSMMVLWMCLVLLCVASAAVSAAAYAGSPGWHWTNPKPQGNSLSGLWMAAPDDVWGVGGFVVMHWDGDDWSTHASEPTWYLTDIFGFSRDDIWASGSSGLLLHWDGISWQTVTLETTGYLGAIWGYRPDDIWMDTSMKGILYHYDGSGWEQFDTGLDRHFIKFWGAASDDIWAIGDEGSMLHWDGKAWTEVYLSYCFMRDIFGVSGTDIRAIGLKTIYYPPDEYFKYGWVFRWD
ncbi:MAG TPA: hypothetical protein PLV45_18835, partial [bacterium]|nr:hypothetical protein [bacterium]